MVSALGHVSLLTSPSASVFVGSSSEGFEKHSGATVFGPQSNARITHPVCWHLGSVPPSKVGALHQARPTPYAPRAPTLLTLHMTHLCVNSLGWETRRDCRQTHRQTAVFFLEKRRP